MRLDRCEDSSIYDYNMSQGSSNPASPSRPVMVSELQETLTTVSHAFGLSEVSASLEALNIEVERKPTVVHRAQTSYSLGASMTPWSPNARDHRRSTQASPLKLKRYALQIWLEVEVGPGYFLPPEDDSYSTDFALEVLNRAYPGCTGVYLDRGGHMLAFYGQKGSPKAGLIQDVAIEAGHAVREILTWMGLAAKWRVRCVSLAEAKDILAGCKRLEQETRRRERQYFQERFAPCTNPLDSQLMLPRFNRGSQCLRRGRLRCQGIHLKPRERVHRMVALRLVAQPPHRSARYLPPWGVPTRQPLMTTSPQMEVWWTPPPTGKEKGAAGAEEAKAERAKTALTPSDPPPPAEAEGRRRMGFLAKSRSQSLVVRRVIQGRSLMPSGSGLGASPTIGTTMRTLT